MPHCRQIRDCAPIMQVTDWLLRSKERQMSTKQLCLLWTARASGPLPFAKLAAHPAADASREVQGRTVASELAGVS